MNDEKFRYYYYNFLDYTNKELIICSNNREKRINGFYYPVIISIYNKKVIYSISPNYFLELKGLIERKNIKNYKEIEILLKDFFENKSLNISIQRMVRMTRRTESDVDTSSVINVNYNYKDIYYNSFEYINDIKYKYNKWLKLKQNRYLNGIIKDDQFVSVGFVSNIDYNGRKYSNSNQRKV